MKELLVKYKDVDDMDDYSYLSANFYKDNVASLLQIIKQVDSINLNDEYYTYESSEFVPSKGNGYLDVLHIYVSSYED